MTHFYAFLAGFSVMFLSFGCLAFSILRALEKPEIRLAVVRGILDGIESFFPAIAVIDVEGVERLIRFPALRHSMLRILQGQVAKSRVIDRERSFRSDYDA